MGSVDLCGSVQNCPEQSVLLMLRVSPRDSVCAVGALTCLESGTELRPVTWDRTQPRLAECTPSYAHSVVNSSNIPVSASEHPGTA